ncbi:hypothetical protein [Sinomicrobium sp. M5D2P17]
MIKRVSNFSLGTWEGGGKVSSFPADIIYLLYNDVGVSLTEVRFQVPPKANALGLHKSFDSCEKSG